MIKGMTVGELRKAIDGVPDDLEVKLSSDTGVDQGEGIVIIEKAYRTKYETDYFKVDHFTIYVNDYYEDDLDDEED